MCTAGEGRILRSIISCPKVVMLCGINLNFFLFFENDKK